MTQFLRDQASDSEEVVTPFDRSIKVLATEGYFLEVVDLRTVNLTAAVWFNSYKRRLV